MIVFFTFLTFYSAYFDKVKDCGCFGDKKKILKLTPWESFTKDVVLLALILIIFFGRKYITQIFSPIVTNSIAALSLILSLAFGYHADAPSKYRF